MALISQLGLVRPRATQIVTLKIQIINYGLLGEAAQQYQCRLDVPSRDAVRHIVQDEDMARAPLAIFKVTLLV